MAERAQREMQAGRSTLSKRAERTRRCAALRSGWRCSIRQSARSRSKSGIRSSPAAPSAASAAPAAASNASVSSSSSADATDTRRHACLRSVPRVAFLESRPHIDEKGVVRGRYNGVEGAKGRAILVAVARRSLHHTAVHCVPAVGGVRSDSWVP